MSNLRHTISCSKTNFSIDRAINESIAQAKEGIYAEEGKEEAKTAIFNPHAEQMNEVPNTKTNSSLPKKTLETDLPFGFETFVQELETISEATITKDSPLDQSTIGISCTLIKMYQTAIEVYFWKKDKPNYRRFKSKLHNFLKKPHMQKIAFKRLSFRQEIKGRTQTMVKSSLDLDDERSVQIKPLTNQERFEKIGLQKLVVKNPEEVTESNKLHNKPSPASQKKAKVEALSDDAEGSESAKEAASASQDKSSSNQTSSSKVRSDKSIGEKATNGISAPTLHTCNQKEREVKFKNIDIIPLGTPQERIEKLVGPKEDRSSDIQNPEGRSQPKSSDFTESERTEETPAKTIQTVESEDAQEILYEEYPQGVQELFPKQQEDTSQPQISEGKSSSQEDSHADGSTEKVKDSQPEDYIPEPTEEPEVVEEDKEEVKQELESDNNPLDSQIKAGDKIDQNIPDKIEQLENPTQEVLQELGEQIEEVVNDAKEEEDQPEIQIQEAEAQEDEIQNIEGKEADLVQQEPQESEVQEVKIQEDQLENNEMHQIEAQDIQAQLDEQKDSTVEETEDQKIEIDEQQDVEDTNQEEIIEKKIKQEEPTTEEILDEEQSPKIPSSIEDISEESLEVVYDIMRQIAIGFNKLVFDESEESSSESSEQSVNEVAPQPPVQTHIAPKRRPKKRAGVDPHLMVRDFSKADEKAVRAVKINILEQSESLAAKLSDRRRKRKHPYSKRYSIRNGHHKDDALSKSFLGKEMEDTLATDSLQNFGLDQPNSFQVNSGGENDFKEIFNVLAELEDDSNLFGDINNPGLDSKETTPSDDKNDEYEQKKEEFLDQYKQSKDREIAEIKKTYDDEIANKKAEGNSKLIKGMIKNIKKERDAAVKRVKDNFKKKKDEFLGNLREEYGIQEGE
ncbi:unnamed protein product [Moneuplotes crassus]|uniref:Uncharacterized protein n=1 Tax=Euplotes crassus TaxID=5936 RepID=A0AAD1XU06_EUPCR|nr:unnamed protein product [Moneuplotes crassus]